MKIKLSDIAEGKLSKEQGEAIQGFFKKGGTWQELLHLKPEEVEEVYAIGHSHYQMGEYDKALASFSALIQLNPYESKHWLAIGAALQAKGEFLDAHASYEIALTFDKENILLYFYLAQCSYALGKKEECRKALQKVIELSEKTEKEMALADKARLILKALEEED